MPDPRGLPCLESHALAIGQYFDSLPSDLVDVKALESRKSSDYGRGVSWTRSIMDPRSMSLLAQELHDICHENSSWLLMTSGLDLRRIFAKMNRSSGP